MRTLKKVLALSLVFAMAFTMMAGAAFKDQDKIDSSLTNDIQLLTALGVFQGDENGNFNPTDNVKRSEAAKMIYVLKNNGVDDGAVAFQGVSKYSDVPVGHWAEGYINYCTNLGYMSGWQENGVQKFDPNGNVTGVELMKMLLCMIGYKADVQGYTGNGWQTNVLVDAATSGLSVEFTPSVYAATPRQWTARLMTNALDAKWVAYSKGELTYQNDTYGQQFLKLFSVKGELTGTQTNALANRGAGTVLTDNKFSTISVEGEPVNFEYAASNDLLGQEVRVYFRGNSATENALGTENKVYGVVATGDEKIINTTPDAVTIKDGKLTVDGLGTKTYTADDKIHVYVNYNHKGEYTVTAGDACLDDKWLDNELNLPVKLVANSKGMITKVMITGQPVYGIVTKLDATNGIFEMEDAAKNPVKLKKLDNTDIAFNKTNKENFEKYLNVASDVKVGDVVQCLATVDGEAKWNVTKAQVLGAATGYTVDKDGNYETIKIDGTDYKLAALHMTGYDWSVAKKAGTHATFYTDGKYVVYSTPSAEVASVTNLAYLIDGGVNNDAFGKQTLKVKVLLADGTQGEYTLDQEAGVGETLKTTTPETPVDATEFNALENEIYTYTLNDDVIVLKTITTATDGALKDNGEVTFLKADTDESIEYDKETGVATVATVDGSSNADKKYTFNDSTYFFVKSGETGSEKYSVLKGSELKGNLTSSNNKATAKTYAAQTINGFDTLLAGILNMTELPSEAVKDYYFVTGSANYIGKVDGKYVVEMTANMAGTETKLTFKYSDADVNDEMKALNKYVGKIVNVTLNTDGSVKGNPSVVTTDWAKGELTAWDGSKAVIGGAFKDVASDVKVFNVDVNDAGDSAKLVEGDTIVKSEANKTSVVYLTKDDKIVAIFCEVDGMDASYLTNPVA